MIDKEVTLDPLFMFRPRRAKLGHVLIAAALLILWLVGSHVAAGRQRAAEQARCNAYAEEYNRRFPPTRESWQTQKDAETMQWARIYLKCLGLRR